jgi:Chs5-Arf1p-binding protein BUD7/BCH1
MEEEYRMQKAQGDILQTVIETSNSGPALVIHEDGHAVPRTSESSTSAGTTLNPHDDDDDASTRAMVSPSSASDSLHRNVNGNGSLDAVPSIPTIRVSTESDIEKEEAAQDTPVNGQPIPNDSLDHDTLERPVQAAAGDGADQEAEIPVSASQDAFSFSNKRLCERWLDNLFMVLYEAG